MAASDDIERVRKKIVKATNDAIEDMASALLNAIPEKIRKRSRAGKDVNGKTFDKLSDGYKDKRKKNKRNLSPETGPGRSNITATGQMLDNIVGEKTAPDELSFTIGGKRSKELDGSEPKLSNKQVAKYVEENGREFFELNKFERKAFEREFKKKLEKAIADAMA